MKFTKYELSVIEELEKRAGEVLYIGDLAPFFISKSWLSISTYMQTAYIQLGDNMQSALSEYFQLVVFIKKLESNGYCYSIPYTPLEDNTSEFGNQEFSQYKQHTIADGDLLVQLFLYAGKKYVMAPLEFEEEMKSTEVPKTTNNIGRVVVPSIILFLLFVFVGFIGYQAFTDHNEFQIKQDAISSNLKEQTQNVNSLSEQIAAREENYLRTHNILKENMNRMNSELETQNKSLRNINYWNRKQYQELRNLIEVINQDSVSSN